MSHLDKHTISQAVGDVFPCLDDVSVYLSEKPLYSSRRVLLKCLKALRSSKNNLAAVSPLILRDPGLTVRVLKNVNRVRRQSGKIRMEISSMRSAIHLLGENALKRVLVSAPVIEDKLGDKETIDAYYGLVDRAVSAAFLAKKWACLRNDTSPEEIEIATLLRDMGEMALCTHYFSDYRRVKAMAEKKHTSFSLLSKKLLGFCPMELSIQLARHWLMPEAVRDVCDSEKWHLHRLQCVALASECMHLAEFGWYHQDMLACQTITADYLNTDLGSFCSGLHQDALHLTRSNWLHNPTSLGANLVNMPMESRKYQEKIAQIKAKQHLQQVRLARKKQVQDKEERQRKEVLTNSISQIKKMAGEGGPTIEFLKTMMDGLNRGVGLDRVAFAKYDKADTTAQIVIAQGMERSDSQALVFDCSKDNLFGSLMKSPSSIWINEDNFDEFSSLIPEQVCELIRSKSFICTSLFCGKHPLGLVYSDTGNSKKQLVSGAYSHAKSLVMLTGKAIEASKKVKQNNVAENKVEGQQGVMLFSRAK